MMAEMLRALVSEEGYWSIDTAGYMMDLGTGVSIILRIILPIHIILIIREISRITAIMRII